MLGISIFALLQPFIANRRSDFFSATPQKKRDERLTNYERVLVTIRDLDEDYNTGKLAQDSYQQERAYWTEQGIMLLRELEPQEEIAQSAKKSAKQSQAETQLEDAVEKAIAEYRKAKA